MKNRSERNNNYRTLAQQIFEGKELLTKRPDTMPYDDYRFLIKGQNEILKQLFHKGNSPSKKLIGVMGTNITKTSKGVTRRFSQRKQG